MLKNFPIKTIVLVALPGSGKTSLVKALRREYGDGFAVDLDYKGSKHVSDKIRALHTQLVNAYAAQGVRLVTTFDGWIEPLNLDTGILCVYCLPEDVSVLTHNALMRDGGSDFSLEYSKKAKEWMEKWVYKSKILSRIPTRCCSSLTITANIKFSDGYYLHQWFIDFLHVAQSFLDGSYLSKLNRDGSDYLAFIAKCDWDRFTEWYRNYKDMIAPGLSKPLDENGPTDSEKGE